MASTNHDAHAHGSHHVFEPRVLLATFGGLVLLTVLTVGLGLLEDSGAVHLGAFTVPVALAIAGAKAALVALFFMGLRYDGGSNALAFLFGIIFLAVFLVFTFLDTGLRGTWDARERVPIDVLEAQAERDRQTYESIRSQLETQPLIAQPDSAVFRP